MRPAHIFREYIWLISTIHRHQRLTFEEINHHWLAEAVKEQHLAAAKLYE